MTFLRKVYVVAPRRELSSVFAEVNRLKREDFVDVTNSSHLRGMPENAQVWILGHIDSEMAFELNMAKSTRKATLIYAEAIERVEFLT